MRISFDENNYVDHVVFNGDTKIEGYDKETPYDFMEKHLAYRLEDNVLVFDSEKWEQIEAKRNTVNILPSVEDRLEALEAAMLEMILGGATE